MGLTRRQVRDAKPKADRYYLRDDDPKGLSLVVHPTGRKVWTLDYRNEERRKRRINIGPADAFDLDQARDAARAHLRNLAKGTDPLDAKQIRKDRVTVSEALDHFLEKHIPSRISKGRMAERTAREYRNQIEKYLRPALSTTAVEDVTRIDVERLLRPLAPVLGNRVRALASSVFTQCEHWGYRPQRTNPVRGIEPAKEVERDRTLSTDELAALGKALIQMSSANEFAVLAIRLAALTGLRIGEIRNMRWTDIDFATGRLTLPHTKTGRRTHTLPTPALALLSETKRIGDWIIAGRSEKAPLGYKAIHNVWKKGCETAGIVDATPHDLRRTVMTTAAASGASAHVLRDLLGHKTLTMATRYVRSAGEAQIELRERIGTTTAAVMEGKQCKVRNIND